VTPSEILAARQAAGLSQAAAAELVHLGGAIRWSEYERGVRTIDSARWQLFLLLTHQHKTLVVTPKA
jgi:transcriptional regulator with XRE-family HTH domain